MGYWIGKPFWGRGFATEATKARWNGPSATGPPEALHRRRHFADNDASGQVLIKAGFLYTGVVEHQAVRSRAAPAATRMMVWLA
jgi:RimJ/RimL family protein N-acetyltransferase